MKLRTRLIAIAIVALATTSCEPGELDLLIEDFPMQEMSSSDDPSVRASGETAVEVLSAQQAETTVEDGFETGNLETLRDAQTLRPGDTRYWMFEIVMLDNFAVGDTDDHDFATEMAVVSIRRDNPGLSHDNLRRVAAEQHMGVLREAIDMTPEGEPRDRMVDQYCRSLNQTYPEHHTESDPAAAAVFLATADHTICN